MDWQNQSLSLFKVSMEQLFKELYFAQTEDDVDKVINSHPIFSNKRIGAPSAVTKTISGSSKTNSRIPLPH